MKKNRPAIVSVGRTKFGEYYEREPEHMVEDAGLAALESVNIERSDLNACFFADYFLPITNKIGLEEGYLSELLELNIPMEITRSFSSALSNACNAVQSEKYDLVLVGGMEKMTDRWDKIRDDLMLLEDPWSYYAGCTPEANHELLFRAYIRKYKVRERELDLLRTALAEFSVRDHSNALKNEFAQFQKKISVEDVIRARSKEGRPLGLLDFAPISDGASALILTSSDQAESYTKKPVYVVSNSLATDYITYPSRIDLTGFTATRIAMADALRTGDVELDDISFLELYDQSTMMGIVSLEDLGFSEKGKAWIDIHESYQENDECYILGSRELFINTDGGLKADGNPLGATGGAEIFEVFQQLRQEAGKRQVKRSSGDGYGCIHELEGFGTKSYIYILGRDLSE